MNPSKFSANFSIPTSVTFSHLFIQILDQFPCKMIYAPKLRLRLWKQPIFLLNSELKLLKPSSDISGQLTKFFVKHSKFFKKAYLKKLTVKLSKSVIFLKNLFILPTPASVISQHLESCQKTSFSKTSYPLKLRLKLFKATSPSNSLLISLNPSSVTPLHLLKSQ